MLAFIDTLLRTLWVVCKTQSFGQTLTKAEVDALIADADENADGKINYSEFCAMMRDTGKTGLKKVVDKGGSYRSARTLRYDGETY